MSTDVFDVPEELAARGCRLRGQLLGDFKPVDAADPTVGALPSAWAVSLSWPAADALEHQVGR